MEKDPHLLYSPSSQRVYFSNKRSIASVGRASRITPSLRIEPVRERFWFLVDSSVFRDKIAVEDLMNFFAFTLCRSFPKLSIALSDDDDDVVYEDPYFIFAESVYELFISLTRVVAARAALESQLTEHVIHNICNLFLSNDHRERKMIRQVIHRIYGLFSRHRPLIRSTLRVILLDAQEEDRTDAIQDILSFYAIILKGIAVPVHPEHVSFLRECLFPLLRLSRIEPCFLGLRTCFIEFARKEDALGIMVRMDFCE